MQTPKKLADTQVLPFSATGQSAPGSQPLAPQRKPGEELIKSTGAPSAVASALAAASGAIPAAAGSFRGTLPTSSRGIRALPTHGAASVMNQHLSFDGNLRFSGTLTIDCEFRGSVSTDDTLVVGPLGRVEAEISAGVIEISGKVHGNMRAKTRVKILSGGEVTGNIETPTISMEDGVTFEGNCSRPSAAASRSAQPQTELEKALRAAEEIRAVAT